MSFKKKITILNGMRHLFWFFISIPLSWFASIKKDRVILASNSGGGLSGNARYLFETWHNKGTFEVWAVVSDNAVYEELLEQYNNVLFLFSWKALRILTRARFFIITHGRLDIPVSYYRKTVIQTWHGIPFKSVGFYSNKRLKDKIRNLLYKWFDYNSIAYFLSSSPYVTKLLSGLFRQNTDKFLEIGFPRNDVFQKDRKDLKKSFYSKLKGRVHDFEKVILYAPTYRPYPSGYFPFSDYQKSCNAFLDLLHGNKAACLLKSHVNQQYQLDAQLRESNRVMDISNDKQFPDLQNILPNVDVLITDYSSVSIDALLLNIPCVYINSDVKKYIHAVGDFCCDYSSLAAGVRVFSMAELIIALRDLFKGYDSYKEERLSALELFFSDSAYSSTEKLASFMKSVSGEH